MKIISKKSLKKTKFLEMVCTNYMDTKGRLAQWWWCRRPKGVKAVVIIAVKEFVSSDGRTKFQKLIVTSEYRVPIEGIELGFPAGLIDPGETPEDAIRRELEEETGLIVEEIIHISPEVLSSAGMTDEAVHLAYVKVSGEPNKDKLDASEEIDTYELDKDQVGGLLDESRDSKYTIGKLAYAEMRKFARFGEI